MFPFMDSGTFKEEDKYMKDRNAPYHKDRNAQESSN